MPLDSSVPMLSLAAGAFFGALTPRVAYRLSVAWGEPALAGCTRCGQPFAAGPAGWWRFAARCADCGVRQGPSPWWTVPVGALAAGLTATSLAGQGWVLVAALLLSVVGVLLAAIDLAVQRLPDPIVWRLALAVAALLALAAATGGGWAAYGRALGGGAALLAGFGLMALLTGGQIGLGDAKVAGVLGLLLGWYGWGPVLLGGLLALLLNGVVAVVLLVARRISWRGSLPMGPSLLGAALLAVMAIGLLRPAAA
ncbi:prepilin peptidase [Catellatospora sichuanensis]|uniref:prepilin peptidase n=1 Tax=Catellatospora sichuanensis TaxID=1969805 RepID=UPI0011825A46|nr:prepilin peptidase [Catellatospora sichuanensis]